MTVVITNDYVREQVVRSRTENKELMIITNSGSRYFLTPVNDTDWKIVRLGVDEHRVTTHYGQVYGKAPDYDRLMIGPWETTGLKHIGVL